jgi:hypothetical protein
MAFEKGKSGNPLGRPSGKSKHQKLADKLARAIELDAVDVVRAVVRAAKKGDMTAAKLILDRLVPPMKAREPGGDRGRPLININVTGLEGPSIPPLFPKVEVVTPPLIPVAKEEENNGPDTIDIEPTSGSARSI